MIVLLIMTIMQKKGNKESLEPDPYDCANDNGKLLED